MLIAVFYSYSQTGTYMVSLKTTTCYSSSPITYFYSAIISDPTGNTTTQVLPHALNDDINYHTQINLIFSNITTQGYHLAPVQVNYPAGLNAAGCTNTYANLLFAPCCAP